MRPFDFFQFALSTNSIIRSHNLILHFSLIVDYDDLILHIIYIWVRATNRRRTVVRRLFDKNKLFWRREDVLQLNVGFRGRISLSFLRGKDTVQWCNIISDDSA